MDKKRQDIRIRLPLPASVGCGDSTDSSSRCALEIKFPLLGLVSKFKGFQSAFRA